MNEKELTGYPSIDKPWLKYYKPGASKIDKIDLTYYEYFIKANKNFLDNVGIEFYKKEISRREIIKQSDNAAKLFKGIGVKKGSQILLGSIGIPESFYILMGLSKIGAGANIINITYPYELILDSIKQSECKVFIVLDVFYDLFEEVLKSQIMKNKKIIVLPFTNSFPFFKKLFTFYQRQKYRRKFYKLKNECNLDLNYYNEEINNYKNLENFTPKKYDKNLKFLTVYSSGTTSSAKGIDLSIDTITYMAKNHELADLGTNEYTASLHKVPINFSTGVNNNFLLPPLVSMINILDPIFDKKTIGKSFMNHKNKVSVAIISNEMWEAVGNTKLKKDTLSKLTHPIAGGDGASAERQEKIYKNLQKFGCKVPLYSGAGSSEVGACATTMLRQAYKAGTAGVPLPQVNVMIIDENEKELKYNQLGEICYSTPMMMLGYTNNEIKTKESFLYVNSEKFYKTGDIGFVDEDGFVTYKGRKNDFLVLKDNLNKEVKQYLFEIEELIRNHSYVTDCEVIGLDLIQKGYKQPVVHIQFDNKSFQNKAAILIDIIKDLNKNLPIYSIPIAIKPRDSFPIAKSGKRDIKAMEKEQDGYIIIPLNAVGKVDYKTLEKEAEKIFNEGNKNV